MPTALRAGVHDPPSGKCIFLASLGASWAVIPEIMCWLDPTVVDLYANGTHRIDLDAARASAGLRVPDEAWICTTEGAQTRASVDKLLDWWRRVGQPMPLRIWSAAGTDQLADEGECLRVRELTLRLALAASELAGPAGQLLVSLAGGRKTMSADMQDAGHMFGAVAMLHVVGPEPMPTELRKAPPDLFAIPLSTRLADAVAPMVVGAGTRSDLLDIEFDGNRVEARHFPLPMAEPGTQLSWAPAASGDRLLHHELALRRRDSQRLWGNFIASVEKDEPHEAWASLFRLNPALLTRLQTERLDGGHQDWLRSLPKADLHRHVGGCLDIDAQREVAQYVWESLDGGQRDAAMACAQPLLECAGDWPWAWPETLKRCGAPLRTAATAALLSHASRAALERNLYAVTAPRVRLKDHPQGGFARYERPGELSGSAQLSHPAAIAPYARALVRQCGEEGLAYVELRGSPQKYRPQAPGEFLKDFESALLGAGARTRSSHSGEAGPRVGFIWIVDRRQRANVAQVVRAAVDAHALSPEFVLGLDLAGDEGTDAPAALAADFAPAFEACMRITIHAGEGESAENIWQAAYHLHADRIGHGLSLVDRPDLAQRFRDRGIALELCPTSNREVVGFHDPLHAQSAECPRYRLRDFMRAGLPLTICTDNPGISRTTLAEEFLCAARMAEDGLTVWETLAILRQGFVHAFLPGRERDRLRRNVEHRMFDAVSHFRGVNQ